MSAAERFSALARRYGQRVTLLDGDGTAVADGYGFVQPLMSESKEYQWQTASKLGTYDGARFRFLGEADLADSTGDFALLLCLGRRFLFQEVQPVYLQEQRVYWWGILTCADEEDDCT
ncbi:MAG: hypothetical protein LUD79_02845 [Oscillospiraceae bacterium]|nr:hypothetical protein [Oscillospiraceae bacterium]